MKQMAALLNYPLDRMLSQGWKMYIFPLACILWGLSMATMFSMPHLKNMFSITYLTTWLMLSAVMLLGYFWFVFVSGICDAASAVSLRMVPALKWRIAFTTVALLLFLDMLVITAFAEKTVFFAVFCGAAFCATRRSSFLRRFAVVLLVAWVVTWPFWDYLTYQFPHRSLLSGFRFYGYAILVTTPVFAIVGFIRVFPLLFSGALVAWLAIDHWLEPVIGIPYWQVAKRLQTLGSEQLRFTFFSFTSLALVAILLCGLIGRPAKRLDNKRQDRLPPWKAMTAFLRRELFSSRKSSLPPLPGYNASLRAALARKGEPDLLLIFGLGRFMHWSTVAWASLGYSAIAAILLFQSLSLFRPEDRPHDVRSLSSLMAIMIVPTFIYGLRQVAYRLRKEQALLCLAPGTPRGQAQTRWFAQAMARHLLRFWALSLALTAAMVWISGVEWMVGIMPVSLATLLLLGALLYLTQDYSRMSKPGAYSMDALLPVVPAMLAWISAFAWKWPIHWLGIPFAVTMLVLLAWRWRKMLAAPQPWPVGRLAAN